MYSEMIGLALGQPYSLIFGFCLGLIIATIMMTFANMRDFAFAVEQEVENQIDSEWDIWFVDPDPNVENDEIELPEVV